MKPEPDAARRAEQWRHRLRLTGVLLALWFVVSFGVSFFARELTFSFFGWPFSFWVAAQGALVVYVVIIFVYARAMDRLDDENGIDEEDD